MTTLQSILLTTITAYALACLGLFVFQRSIIYKPIKEQLAPAHYGLETLEQIPLTSKDGTGISIWYSPAPNNRPTMVYFQGNAGNLADRREKIETFIEQGIGFVALNYRGYGSSEGKPTEKGIYDDARRVFEYLASEGITLDKVFVYGESLGSGVAVQMATEYDFSALILEAPFMSVSQLARERYPIFPTELLLQDTFSSIKKIGDVHIPLLAFHGYVDQVTPIHHSRKLLDAANEPKEARFFDNVGHTDFRLDQLARYTMDFVHKHQKK